MIAGLTRLLLLGAAAVAVVAGGPSVDTRAGRFDDWRMVEDSLRQVPPKFREMWLRERGIEWPGYTASPATDSGLTLVGKWGRGPAVEVTGRDTLVVLTLGSEVALLSFADPDEPRVLSEIQFSSMTGQSQLVGSRLYVGSGGTFEAWDVSDAASPIQLGSLPYGIGDFQVNDTLLYFLRLDTFEVFSVADPQNMYQLGACRDSGYFLAATESTVVLGHSRRGLYLVDVTDPRSPHRVGSFPSDQPLSAAARHNLVCVTLRSGTEPYPIRFVTLDISDPASPRQLGVLNDAGGYDVFLDGPLAFASGRDLLNEPFQVVSVADSTHPGLMGQCRTTDRYGWGVWADVAAVRAFVANEYDGLSVVDISNLSNPVCDTHVVVAATAYDLAVDGGYCFVADGQAGLKVLDISNPANPRQIGEVDTSYGASWSYAVAACDSFAFMSFYYPWFRSVDVSDPANPRMAGNCTNPPNEEAQDFVLRDSFVYAAMNYDFNVINVARPREPQVVGTCNMVGGQQWGADLQDTLAYCGSWDGLTVVNIARADSPYVVSQTSGTRLSCDGVAVRDSLAFVPSVYETLWVYSVADPRSPYPIAGVPLGESQWGYDATMINDTLVFVGCKYSVAVVNVRDPAHPAVVGRHGTPSWVRRVECSGQYLYACCTDGGVAVFELNSAGVSGPGAHESIPASFRVRPVPVGVAAVVELPPHSSPATLRLYDVTGREVQRLAIGAGQRDVRLELGSLNAGVYCLTLDSGAGAVSGKFVKR